MGPPTSRTVILLALKLDLPGNRLGRPAWPSFRAMGYTVSPWGMTDGGKRAVTPLLGFLTIRLCLLLVQSRVLPLPFQQ